MRIDQLTLRAAAAALVLLSVVVVLASPQDVLDVPVDQLLLGDLAWLLRLTAAAAGLLVVLSLATLSPALDPERGRRAVPVLLGAAGLALVVFAFTTPVAVVVSAEAGTVVIDVQTSATSALNTIALLVVSTTLPAALIVQAARWRRAEATDTRAKVAFAAAVVSLWAALAFSLAQDGTIPAAGLWQRVALVVAWGWLAAVLLRTAAGLTSGSAGTRR